LVLSISNWIKNFYVLIDCYYNTGWSFFIYALSLLTISFVEFNLLSPYDSFVFRLFIWSNFFFKTIPYK
jgi:hypothetical protein